MSIEQHEYATARGTLPYLFRKANSEANALAGKTPLVVFLHGAKDRGNDLSLPLAWGFPKFAATARQLPYNFLALQIPQETTWPEWRDELFALIDLLLEAHAIDRDRVVLSGFSLGSAGTWLLGSAHPERFAGLVVVSGRPPEAMNAERLAALQNTPVQIFHGGRDDKAPLGDAENAVGILRALHAPLNFTIIPEGDHFIADAVYGDPGLQSWLANIPPVRRKQAAAA
ncbi:MAG: phospholipase [Rhodocyclales bacterium]|nr:phospholipase [Rhodocyclales bacterium]